METGSFATTGLCQCYNRTEVAAIAVTAGQTGLYVRFAGAVLR